MVRQQDKLSFWRMDGKTRIGLNLQRLRRKNGLTQEELADRAELHQTYISGIERGIRNPTIIVIDKLADALEAEPEELVTWRFIAGRRQQ